MDEFTCALINFLCATSLDQTMSLALVTLANLTQSEWVCLLLWDAELERYIVGDTWLDTAQSEWRAPDLRRWVLRLANEAWRADSTSARAIEPGFYFEPLNVSEQRVAALCIGLDEISDPIRERFDLFRKSVTRALYTTSRLQQADQERLLLESERLRLEQLLQAVEEQQRTIDQLLAAERQLSASLEAKVEERTAALRAAQTRLIQSEKLAVIGQLASSLAHELNNPLQAIQSGLGLVMNELQNPDHAREDLAIIQQELERIQSIFRQMLDFYRPATYDFVPLDLNAICEGVRVLMRKRLQEANVSLRLELANHLPLTCGDSNQIKQALLNLILNAAEAMESAGGHITLRTAHNGQQVCLTVIDDGRGIAPEHRAQLFEPLFTTKTRGMGLGLAITQEIVQRHGGEIVVHSTPGVGTTFTLFLPVRERCDEKQPRVGR